jgi:penicillin amidase
MKQTDTAEKRNTRLKGLSKPRRRRMVLTTLLASAGLAGAVILAGLLFVWWSLPVLSGTLALPGLRNYVRVVRDQWGIPHIFASDELDAFRALGFVAAQDRLFQMDIHRRVANGQVSEVLGAAALQIDELSRTLGFRHYAEKLLASNAISPEVLRAAEAYRDGLNYYVATQKLPVEFTLLGYEPRHFEIVEMLAFGGYLSYSFSEAFRGDILYSDLLNELPPEKLNELRGGIENSAPTIASGVKIGIDRNLFATLHNDPLLQVLGAFNGSNSWVVSPRRSKSGRAILVNDPHIGFSKPSVWYEAHITSPTLEVYGHFVSFVPFPVLGHTRDIAWAITMSEVDDMDFYREKTNPQNPNEIFFRNQWVKLENRDEKIVVRGGNDVVLKVQTGPHGPLVQRLFDRPAEQLISMKWQNHEPDNLLLETFFDLAHAKTVAGFSAALKKEKAPGLNISYADRAGNIAWWVIGQIPIRPANSQPDMVLDGASGADEYLGYVPFAENPHLVNPDNGMIITANNKPAQNTPYALHGYFQPSEGIVQLQRLLQTQEQWSREDFMKIQTNQDEVFAADQVPLLVSLVPPPEDGLERNAYAVLQHWDGHSDVSSVGAAIYNEWRSQILRNTLLDELGEERFKVFCTTADAWHFYKRLIKNPASQWWDNVQTKDHIETREEIVTQAFQQAVAVLSHRFGRNVSNWNWGKLHTVEYVHVLGRQKPLNFFFNAGPYPAGGNYSQVDAMAPARGEETFEVIYGPSTRRIVDFSHVEKSWGINPLGNSGNLLSRHERDQVGLFLHGQYRPQLMDAAEIQRNAETTLSLTPN